MSRHFRVEAELSVGTRVPLDAARFVRVLRKAPGDAVRLCDARGRLFDAVLVSASPCEAEILAEVPNPGRDAARALAVWLPLLKGGRSDDLVRQLTELGVTHIVPFQSRYSVVQLEPKKAASRVERLQAIAREATNQCGRLKVPEVLPVATALPRSGPGIFFWEAGGLDLTALPGFVAGVPIGVRLGLLFGPEGGLSPEEAAGLADAGWQAFSLGPRILRAETAVVVGTALVQAALGALSG